MNDLRNQLEMHNQEGSTYKQRIQKLMAENGTLGEEVRTAQENLRLSNSQIGKVTN